MRVPRSIGLICGAAAMMLPTLARAEFVLFRQIWGNAVVNTDMTAAGRKLTPPTPENPVYFRGLTLGAKLGSIPGDEEPPPQEVNTFVTRLLAKQGYLAAQPGVHEPTIFLVMQWGYMRPGYQGMGWFLGYDERRDIAAGGGLAPLFTNLRAADISTVLEYASEPLYGIIVTAFEFKSANTPQPVIYWQTRIGLPAVGKSMAQALPAMFVAGAPAFGRETSQPVLLDADTQMKGHVTLRDLQFFDEPASASESTREVESGKR